MRRYERDADGVGWHDASLRADSYVRAWHPAAMQAQSRRPLSPSARRALLGVLAAITVYLLLDLLVGVRYATDDKGLVVSDVIALALQAVLVLLVWQRRGWAWIVGAIWAVLSAVGAMAQFLDPAIGGYDADAPRSFVAVQGVLLLVGAGLWFVPDLRPGHRSRIR